MLDVYMQFSKHHIFFSQLLALSSRTDNFFKSRHPCHVMRLCHLPFPCSDTLTGTFCEIDWPFWRVWQLKSIHNDSQLGGGFKYFLFSPRKLGKVPILTNTFQMGWNHQPDYWYPGYYSHSCSNCLNIFIHYCQQAQLSRNWQPLHQVIIEDTEPLPGQLDRRILLETQKRCAVHRWFGVETQKINVFGAIFGDGVWGWWDFPWWCCCREKMQLRLVKSWNPNGGFT